MESEQEKRLKNLKQFLHRLGFDNNKAKESIQSNKAHIRPAVAKINSYLFQYQDCIIAKQWKDHFIAYLKTQAPSMPTTSRNSAILSSQASEKGPIERLFARSGGSSQSVSPMTQGPTPQGTLGIESEISEQVDIIQSAQSSTVIPVRQNHLVSTISQRLSVINWMTTEASKYGEKGIPSKALKQFPHLFCGNYKANHAKVSRWWKQRETYMSTKKEGTRMGLLSGRLSHGMKRSSFKALGGRGRKRTGWVNALYQELLEEFERMQAASIKITPSLLRCTAKALILKASPVSPFHRTVKWGSEFIENRITVRWIQTFMESNQLVLRSQSGNLSVSPEKELQIEREVAFHLGEFKRGFDSGALNEDLVENADETHFIFNMDNGRTVGFRGQEDVRYADVLSRNEGITMMVRITGGERAYIEVPMLVFVNSKCSYPIQGIPDNIPGVCYRSGRRGWMDKRVFAEWLSETRAIRKLERGQKRVLFVDNANGHGETALQKRLLKKINTDLRKFPANATHLVQPADSFIISKIKDAWRKRWDSYKVELIQQNKWKPGDSGSSGKLVNPGKHFFLKMAADSIRDVNSQKDKHGIRFARKTMVRIGMSLNYDCTTGKSTRWEESQQFSNLQEIIAKHCNHFNGEEI